MIWPFRSISLGSITRVRATRPVTLVSITCSIRSQSVSGSGAVGGARPALLSSRSTSPHGGDSFARLSTASRSRMSISSGRKASPSSSCKLAQAVRASSGPDHVPAPVMNVSPKRAEAGGCSRDQDRLGHAVPSISTAAARHEGFRLYSDGFTNGDQIGLMRLEESQSGREQRRVAGPAPQLLCLDSGQCEEPLRAPFVGNRRPKRGKSETIGVVWRLERHRLDRPDERAREAIWPRS